MHKQLPRQWSEIRRDWSLLSFYERFETFIALALTLLVMIVILVALWRLTIGIVQTLLLRSLNPLEHSVFQAVFGEILTLLIALEFNHTLRYVVSGGWGIIQAKIVILIALLALVRKIIVTDLATMPPALLGAEAAMLLALGVTYWLMRDQNDPDNELTNSSRGGLPTE
jgi:uncharacterized membrane protein (DUF373 family)